MLDAVLKGLLLGFWLAISVGPIMFTVIKQSLDNGWRGGLAFILGIFAVDVFLVILCNAFTHLFSILLDYKTPLGIAGSILLVAAGVYYIFYKKAQTVTGKEVTVAGYGFYVRLFLTGTVMNLLNPGILAVWFTTATAFSTYSFTKRLIIFSVALFIALSADVAKVFLAEKLRQKLTIGNIHRMNKITGIIILLFGIGLFLLLVSGKNVSH